MLHGRAAETARIDELIAAARAGRSGALVIRGEPGVGKTALLDYAAEAAAGIRVLRGNGIESEAELPFAALHLLLRPGLARLDLLPPPQARALRSACGLTEASGPAGTPGADRFLIGLAALSLLAELAGDGALLCLIDDTHWLDRASADALLFAARRLEEEGVLLLIAAREDGFDAPSLPELPLGRLGRDASRALLAERSPGLPAVLADRVLAEAAGNPLALLELPAALSEASGAPAALDAAVELPSPLPLPRRLQQSYYRQVAGLPVAVRTFLLVAAARSDDLYAMADLLAGRPAAGVPGLAEVVTAARHVPPEQLTVRFYVANMALLIGDFDRGRDLMLSTAQACRAQGVIRLLAPLSLGLSYADFCLTRFRAATESATEGLRLAQDTGQPVRAAGLYGMLALLAAVGGDEPRCRELAASALRQFAAEEVANVSTLAEWALGLLDLGLGRYGAALNQFEMTATGALRHYIQPILFAPDQIEAAVRFGPAGHGAASAAASAADRAAEPLARFAAWAGATGQPWALAVLHRCQALTGDGDPEAHYREALRQHAVSGRPFEHGRTELLYGEWLRRDRRGMDARVHLRTALALFNRTGAAPWAERARAELRAAGEPAAAGAPAPDRLSLLTPQELQVVRLAAFGATNRDIAAQLFISPRTVSHHLYRAFPKLGVTNRTALARLDLTGPDDLP